MLSKILKTKNPEKNFGTGFNRTIKSSLASEKKRTKKREEMIDEILGHLHEYSESLWLQMGGPNQYMELIITADGNPEYFEKSKTLVEHAPEIPNWKVISLMPPIDCDEIDYDVFKISIDDLAFSPVVNFTDVTAICLAIHVKNYKEISQFENFESAVQKFLDNLLGEECFSYVAYLDIEDWDPEFEPNIRELRNYILTKKEGYSK